MESLSELDIVTRFFGNFFLVAFFCVMLFCISALDFSFGVYLHFKPPQSLSQTHTQEERKKNVKKKRKTFHSVNSAMRNVGAC